MVDIAVTTKHGSEVATVVNEHTKNGVLSPIVTAGCKCSLNSSHCVNDVPRAKYYRRATRSTSAAESS